MLYEAPAPNQPAVAFQHTCSRRQQAHHGVVSQAECACYRGEPSARCDREAQQLVVAPEGAAATSTEARKRTHDWVHSDLKAAEFLSSNGKASRIVAHGQGLGGAVGCGSGSSSACDGGSDNGDGSRRGAGPCDGRGGGVRQDAASEPETPEALDPAPDAGVTPLAAVGHVSAAASRLDALLAAAAAAELGRSEQGHSHQGFEAATRPGRHDSCTSISTTAAETAGPSVRQAVASAAAAVAPAAAPAAVARRYTIPLISPCTHLRVIPPCTAAFTSGASAAASAAGSNGSTDAATGHAHARKETPSVATCAGHSAPAMGVSRIPPAAVVQPPRAATGPTAAQAATTPAAALSVPPAVRESGLLTCGVAGRRRLTAHPLPQARQLELSPGHCEQGDNGGDASAPCFRAAAQPARRRVACRASDKTAPLTRGSLGTAQPWAGGGGAGDAGGDADGRTLTGVTHGSASSALQCLRVELRISLSVSELVQLSHMATRSMQEDGREPQEHTTPASYPLELSQESRRSLISALAQYCRNSQAARGDVCKPHVAATLQRQAAPAAPAESCREQELRATLDTVCKLLSYGLEEESAAASNARQSVRGEHGAGPSSRDRQHAEVQAQAGSAGGVAAASALGRMTAAGAAAAASKPDGPVAAVVGAPVSTFTLSPPPFQAPSAEATTAAAAAATASSMAAAAPMAASAAAAGVFSAGPVLPPPRPLVLPAACASQLPLPPSATAEAPGQPTTALCSATPYGAAAFWPVPPQLTGPGGFPWPQALLPFQQQQQPQQRHQLFPQLGPQLAVPRLRQPSPQPAPPPDSKLQHAFAQYHQSPSLEVAVGPAYQLPVGATTTAGASESSCKERVAGRGGAAEDGEGSAAKRPRRLDPAGAGAVASQPGAQTAPVQSPPQAGSAHPGLPGAASSAAQPCNGAFMPSVASGGTVAGSADGPGGIFAARMHRAQALGQA